MTASASGKAPRQTRTRKPAVTTPPAASKPVTAAKAPAKAGVRKVATKSQPVVDLRAEQPAPQEPVAVEQVPVEQVTVEQVAVEQVTVPDLDAQIAAAAYLLWEQGVPGDADAHWRAAEQMVRA